MKRAPVALALLSGLLLGSCGALDAYPTTPRPLPAVPYGSPPSPLASVQRVGICYNTMTTTLPQVQSQAQGECAADTIAEPSDTDWYMQNCPLLLPARATFVCRSTKPVSTPAATSASTPASPRSSTKPTKTKPTQK